MGFPFKSAFSIENIKRSINLSNFYFNQTYHPDPDDCQLPLQFHLKPH